MLCNYRMNLFKKYLVGKRIDSDWFQRELPREWEALRHEFETGGEKSFQLRKRFMLNPLRLEYPLAPDK